ncbi:MAG: DUF465 domain-containing protein [Burkholderiales bacterium]|nr:DUF465 domain-containing protein [Burkholderiales bacterium]
MRVPNQNLTDSFPELDEAFHYLKAHDEQFHQILKQYEKLDTLVHKVDHEQEIMSDFELEKVKKERVTLKDSLYQMMVKHKSENN